MAPPVVVLSAVSLYSLRQDRASIEADARRNASVAAGELARRIGERLAAGIVAAGDEQIRATAHPSVGCARGGAGTGGARRP